MKFGLEHDDVPHKVDVGLLPEGILCRDASGVSTGARRRGKGRRIEPLFLVWMGNLGPSRLVGAELPEEPKGVPCFGIVAVGGTHAERASRVRLDIGFELASAKQH
jgi:hypothetical protein